MSVAAAVVVALVVYVASTTQATVGFGFALLAVPGLAGVIGPRNAVVVATMGSLANTAGLVFRNRHHVQWRTARRLAASALLGMPAGLAVLLVAPERVLSVVIAAVVLALTVLLARRPDATRTGTAVEVGAGFVSGALVTSVGANGPPLVLALHAQGLAPRRFRATLNAVFLSNNAVAVVLFAAAGQVTTTVRQGVTVAVPALIAGLVTGDRLARRAGPERFRNLVLGLLVVSALASIARAAIG